MNPSKKLINLRGEEYPKSYLTQEEIENLPRKDSKNKGPDGNYIKVPDLDKIERETVGNVIINCLGFYQCSNRKEGWYVNLIAQSMIIADKDKKVELKEKLKKFLIQVLEESMIKKEEEKEGKEKPKVGPNERPNGIYAGWIIAQCLQELGVKFEEE